MGRIWTLHTETKGTGAQMVPLESETKRSPGDTTLVVPPRPRRRPEPAEARPRKAHRFRIVDVVTRRTLAERASTRQAVETLQEVRSPVDIDIYVWREQPDRWRLLTLAEKRMLWDLRNA